MSLDAVFSALSDPTRRQVVEELLAEGETSVPRLVGRLPMSRQAVAKHLAALEDAGLVQRAPGAGREVRYAPRPGALDEAATWMGRAERDWDRRLARLKRAVERG